MNDLNLWLSVGAVIFSIISGGIGAFFIIKKQLLNVTNSALDLTTKELKVYKEKVDRLEQELDDISSKLKLLTQENLSLITERDYLRGLIVAAITSRKEIHKALIDALGKPATDTQLYMGKRGGVK